MFESSIPSPPSSPVTVSTMQSQLRLRVERPIRVQDSQPRNQQETYIKQQRWIEWRNWDLEPSAWWPEWKIKPSEQDVCLLLQESVVRGHLPRALGSAVVSSHNSGGYNILFLIQLDDIGSDEFETESEDETAPQLPRNLLLRLAMPVDAYYKTESEVASACFVREAGAPVPRSFFYDSSGNNELGLEWIVMELVDNFEHLHHRSAVIANTYTGTERSDEYSSMGLALGAHIKAIRLSATFDKIGSLYFDENGGYVVGPLSSTDLTCNRRLLYPVSRGPYTTVQQYIEAYTDVLHHEFIDPAVMLPRSGSPTPKPQPSPPTSGASANQASHDDASAETDSASGSRSWTDGSETDSAPVSRYRAADVPPVVGYTPANAEFFDHVCGRFKRLIARVGPLIDRPDQPLRTSVFHHDLHGNNVLVRAGTSQIIALLDWEHIAVLPDPFHHVPKATVYFMKEGPLECVPMADKISAHKLLQNIPLIAATTFAKVLKNLHRYEPRSQYFRLPVLRSGGMLAAALKKNIMRMTRNPDKPLKWLQSLERAVDEKQAREAAESSEPDME